VTWLPPPPKHAPPHVLPRGIWSFYVIGCFTSKGNPRTLGALGSLLGMGHTWLITSKPTRGLLCQILSLLVKRYTSVRTEIRWKTGFLAFCLSGSLKVIGIHMDRVHVNCGFLLTLRSNHAPLREHRRVLIWVLPLLGLEPVLPVGGECLWRVTMDLSRAVSKIYTVFQKLCHFFAISLVSGNRFQPFFYSYNQNDVFHLTLTALPHCMSKL